MSTDPVSTPVQDDGLGPVGRPWGRWLPFAAALLALAVVAVAAVPVALGGHVRSAAAAGRQVPAVRGPDPAPSARNPLGELAQHLADTAYDRQRGRYTYLHTHYWALDTTATAHRTTSRIAVFDEQLWIAADNSGRDRLARLPDQPAGGPLRWSTPKPGAGTNEDFPAGRHPRSLPEPPSADPDTLAAQLDTIQPRANGPQSVVRAIADIYRDTAPPKPVRAAMLRLLASVGAVTYRGRVTDRAGRPGVAVSVDSDVRDTLIFDESTGVLLAFEAVLLTQPGGLDIGPGAIRESVLYLGYGHTDQVGVPPTAWLPSGPPRLARASAGPAVPIPMSPRDNQPAGASGHG
jgi:hypothetical protein